MAKPKEEVDIDYERVSVLIHIMEKCKHYLNYADIVRSAERELHNIDLDCKEQLEGIVKREQEDIANDERERREKHLAMAQASADAGYQPTAPVTLPNPALAEPPKGTPTAMPQEPNVTVPAATTPAPRVPGANETGMAGTRGGAAEPDGPNTVTNPPPQGSTESPSTSIEPAQPVKSAEDRAQPEKPPLTAAKTDEPTPNADDKPPSVSTPDGVALTRRSV